MAVLKDIVCLFLLLVLACGASVVHAHDQFVDVISASKSAIVIVETTRKKSRKEIKKTLKSLGDNVQFFEDEVVEIPKNSRGSGFIVNYEGDVTRVYTILTAAHVVKGAKKVKVMFSNGIREKAEVILLDKKKDIAILRIVSSKAPKNHLHLASSKMVEGQSVLAIAGSFDLSVSSSLGIVSAVDVELTSKKGLKLIQTDAAINPGSSGGPLLNHQGEVIGMILNIYTNTGGFSGAAFAIPSKNILVLLDKQVQS